MSWKHIAVTALIAVAAVALANRIPMVAGIVNPGAAK